jgi:hypothetical protein
MNIADVGVVEWSGWLVHPLLVRLDYRVFLVPEDFISGYGQTAKNGCLYQFVSAYDLGHLIRITFRLCVHTHEVMLQI